MGMETKNVPFELKGIEENGVFTGYGSVFGVLDFWDDVVVKGAFIDSIQKRMPALLWQHRQDAPIGVYTDIAEDEKGLKVTGRLLVDDVRQAKEAYALLKAGALSGLSIGYIPLDWEYKEDGDVRVLKEVEVWEISLVTFPANDAARVESVKSLDSLSSVQDIEGWLCSKGLTPNEAKSVISKVLQKDAEDQLMEAAKNLLKAMEV